ncbi:SHOCT domain-containing protein [Bordetella bronchiseptica]
MSPLSGHSIADELAKLVALHSAGHLSDNEFDAQKARLLA